MKTFVLLDETLNEYGFWIPLAGLDIDQFKKNPIMLWMHNRSWRGTEDEVLPIGRWDNVRVEDGKLLADAVFDENDEFASKIGDKVENGFLKMASVGVRIMVLSSDPKDLKPGQTRETPTKCKLKEASIVDIGGLDNALSLAFYDADDKLIELSDKPENLPIKLLSNENNQQTETMIDLKKTVGLLKLTDKANDEEISAEVQKLQDSEAKLKSENDTLTLKLKSLEDKQANENKAEAIALVDAAVKEGRLDAAGKESFLKLFESDHATAKVTLAAIPKRTSIKEEIKDEKNLSDAEKLSKLSWEELDKQGKLETLKAANLDSFKAKFKEKFGADYQ